MTTTTILIALTMVEWWELFKLLCKTIVLIWIITQLFYMGVEAYGESRRKTRK